jgi:hypothetical protein
MRAIVAVGLIVSALVLGSCGGGRQAVEINSDAQPIPSRWNGTLSTPPELAGIIDVRGQAWMGADPKDAGQTRAHVDISNAVPGAKHPWHVHRGQCGSDQGIFGPADAYKPLEVEKDGKASATATLQVPTPRTGEYFVNIHASANNMKRIVACGNLAPPAR